MGYFESVDGKDNASIIMTVIAIILAIICGVVTSYVIFNVIDQHYIDAHTCAHFLGKQFGDCHWMHR